MSLVNSSVILALLLIARGHAADTSVKLEPILHVDFAGGRQRLIHWHTLEREKTKGRNIGTAFVAVISTSWPAGLVPLFAVETENTFELRRLPMRGQENHSEPLFFALPPEDETNAVKICGKWNGLASNSQRSNHSPDWELAIDGERVAGRFDPSGEYRVAFISGGTFRSNRFELNVEYINDRYALSGEWRDGKLAGTWHQVDDSDRGTWQATRPAGPAVLPSVTDTLPLYEWRRGEARRYAIEQQMKEVGWQRAVRPLCRVWRSDENTKRQTPSSR